MKIISIKRGFTTNSSASTFWVVLEKNEKAKEEFAKQLAANCSCPGEEIKISVDNFFKESRELSGKNNNFWHRYMRFRRETHDLVPAFGSLQLPAFGLDYQKIIKTPWDLFDTVVCGLQKIEWSDWLYKTIDISNKTTANFIRTVSPISRDTTEGWCMETAYGELLACARRLNDETLNEFIMKLLILYNIGIFDIERSALVNVLYTFLEKAASAKKYHVNLTKARLPDTNYVIKLKKRYNEATGKDLEKTVKTTGSAIWEKFFITYQQAGFKYVPLPAAVKKTENLGIFPAGGFTPGLRAVIECSDAFGLRDEFEKLITESATAKKIEGRLAALLLLRAEKYMNEKIL